MHWPTAMGAVWRYHSLDGGGEKRVRTAAAEAVVEKRDAFAVVVKRDWHSVQLLEMHEPWLVVDPATVDAPLLFVRWWRW
jgi:hypothetical protein